MATTKALKPSGSQAARIRRALRLRTEAVIRLWTEDGMLIIEVLPLGSASQVASKVSGFRPRRPGYLKSLKIPTDFDAPLPALAIDAFGKT